MATSQTTPSWVEEEQPIVSIIEEDLAGVEDAGNGSEGEGENDDDHGDPSPSPPATGEGEDSRSSRIRTLRKILKLMASPLTDETGSVRSIVSGLATILFIGGCVGLAAPPNQSLSPSYRRISSAIGYIYFMAWSVSFYPQLNSNFKRKSTVGLSPDFCVLNVIGFGCYTAYNASFFWSSSIRDLYKMKYGDKAEITVQSNDVAFAIHALVLSFLTLLQIVWYYLTSNYNNNSSSSNDLASTVRLSRPVLLVIIVIAVICVGYPVLVILDKHFAGLNDDTVPTFNWLDYLYLLSYIKVFISLIKYIPQVVLNFQRKSTVGWSIWNILLDFTGGTLSDLQLVLDCRDQHDFSGITRNKAKLALGSLSIVFDLIFFVQHYCLYRNSGPTSARAEQLEPLLPPPPSLPPPPPPTTPETGDTANEDEESSAAGPVTFFV